MADLIRGSSLLQYRELVRSLGGDPEPILAASGVDPGVAGDHEQFLPYSALARTIGATVAALDRSDFPLRLGQAQGITILGPIAVIMRNSATFGEGLRGAVQYLHTYTPAVTIAVDPTPTPRFTFEVALRRVPFRAEMSELSLAIAVAAFRHLLGKTFRPTLVTFRHPQSAPPEAYRETFEAPVHFESADNAVYFEPGSLEIRLGSGDSEARRIAEEYLGDIRPDLAMADHVAVLVSRLLPIGRASVAEAARELGLSVRTLQRELAADGATFASILDEVRRSQTWTLAGTELSSRQVASMVGYAEQSSYTRAVRRWFGITPRQLAAQRRANRREPLPPLP